MTYIDGLLLSYERIIGRKFRIESLSSLILAEVKDKCFSCLYK